VRFKAKVCAHGAARVQRCKLDFIFTGNFEALMNLFRILILGMLVWFVLRVLKSWRVEISPRDQPPPRRRENADQDRFEPMAQCKTCGVHLPQRALALSGRCGACERAF